MTNDREPPARSPSRGRRIAVFVAVLVFGFAMFAAPAIFLQMGNAGGYTGRNLAVLGIVQLLLVGAVVAAGLRALAMTPAAIGLVSDRWRRDALLGAGIAVLWAVVQFSWAIPATGGAARPDIASILTMLDGRWINVLWYLPLGMLGGGIAEEIYGRGFIITVLEDILGGSRWATVTAGVFSALFFAAGHLPGGWVDWMDILVPSFVYVALFLWTRRLIAPMVAHALWNAFAVAAILALYG